MNRHLNSLCSYASISGTRRLLTIVLAAVVGICAIVNVNMVRAQTAGPKVPANVALKVSQRAEKFMRDIAALSPLPPNTDPVHAQAWPRPLDANLNAQERDAALKQVMTSLIFSEDAKNGPAWRVELQGRTGIELVVNAKGTIASFFDWQLMHTLDKDPPAEEEQFISSGTATARALKYMGAMGIDTNEYVLHVVQFANGALPTSARSQTWNVNLDRVWQGIPYLNHNVSLNLDAAQGRLLSGGGGGLAVQSPALARLDVSAEQALTIARRFIMPRVVEITGDADVELRVVLPSHFWTSEERDNSPTTAQSRLAWRVRQPTTVQIGNERTLEVWVDTLTGAILGGDDVGLRGPGKIPPIGGSIGRALRASLKLQAVPVTSPTAQSANKQNGSSVLNLDSGKNKLYFYGLVSGITGPIPPAGNQKPLIFKATHRLTATLADGKTTTYLYDASNGRITTEDGAGDIVQAGAALRAWLSPIALASTSTKSKQAAH